MKNFTSNFKTIITVLALLFSFNLCMAQITLNITVNTTPSCTHNGTATAIVSNGTPPYSYTWYTASGPQYTQFISGIAGGYASVSVIDAAGNTGYAYSIVSLPFDLNATSTPDSCSLGVGTCSLTVTGGTAPFTYLWDNGSTSATATGLNAGFPECTVTDANGCYVLVSDNDTTQWSAEVGYASAINLGIITNPASCLDGSATVNPSNGTPPYSYLWNTAPAQTTQTATGLHANTTYIVTVTDITGCSNQASASVSSGSNITLTINKIPENCLYGNGSATASVTNGVLPVAYAWSNGATTAVISGLTMGSYTLTVTDANGCVRSQIANVNRTSPVQLNVTNVPSSCTVNNGSISLSVTGGLPPYSYYWQTIPIQTTATATALGPGHYTVTVTDANLCSTSNTIVLTDNSSLSLGVTAGEDTCNQSIGIGIATVTGGNVPYTYQWLSSPVQTTPTATGFTEGWHSVTVTDNIGCVRNGKAWVNNYSPVDIWGGAVNASCIYVADGSISPAVTGGITPYTYQWSNGATTASVSGLLTGWYQLTATDAGGCRDTACFFVGYNSVLPCAVVISGRVYNDINANCIQDAGEYGITCIGVHCIPGGGTHFTNSAGDYSFIMPAGTYTVNHNIPQYFSQGCPAGGSYTLVLPMGSTAPNTDFADPGFVNDLALNSYSHTPPVQGFDYWQIVSYINKGSVSTTGTLTVNHDAQLPFIYSKPMPSNYNGLTHTATWNLNNLYPNLLTNIWINYGVPASVLLGTQVHFHDSISPFIADTFVNDNYLWFLETVVGPYDPNYIEVRPSGTGSQGYITASDSAMEYVVHFQNTGTYLAQRVYVKIQLDSHLDANTVQPGASSHNYSAEISPSNELVFTFDNINLPDSTFDEMGSHGFVSYKVKQVPNLLPGTPIYGQANIFFDFSAPVATNNVLNTIITGMHELDNTFNLQFAPNPFNDEFTLSYHLDHADNVTVKICDVTGQTIYETESKHQSAGANKLMLTKEQLQLTPGIYFLNFNAGEKSVTGKIIKM
ncbi:MAG: T9SS type A sorting domain-containing protein [Bacteroidia bacterium]